MGTYTAAWRLIDTSVTALLPLEAPSLSFIKVPYVDSNTAAAYPLGVYSLITKCYAPDARLVPSYMENARSLCRYVGY